MRILSVLFLFGLGLFANDVVLYKKLSEEVISKDKNFHTDGDIKIVIANPKDTNLTKNVKSLLKKAKIVKTTKKYQKILKD